MALSVKSLRSGGFQPVTAIEVDRRVDTMRRHTRETAVSVIGEYQGAGLSGEPVPGDACEHYRTGP
jgi:hypothetical protein